MMQCNLGDKTKSPGEEAVNTLEKKYKIDLAKEIKDWGKYDNNYVSQEWGRKLNLKR